MASGAEELQFVLAHIQRQQGEAGHAAKRQRVAPPDQSGDTLLFL